MRASRSVRIIVAGATIVAALGCEEESATFFVDVITDFEPGVDFDGGETLLFASGATEPLATSSFTAETGTTFATGARVAEFPGHAPGQFEVEVALVLGDEEIARRRVRFTATGSYGVTVPFPVAPCIPSEEVCNGMDDDCDDLVDETSSPICMLEGVEDAACESGACQIGTCVDGMLDCDTDPATGCEVDAMTDDARCGACDVSCEADLSCDRGDCRGLAGYVRDGALEDAPLTLEGRRDGGYVLHTRVNAMEEGLTVYARDGVPEWSELLFRQPPSRVRFALRGMSFGDDGRLHALVGVHNPSLAVQSTDLYGLTVDSVPTSMKYVHAAWAPDGSLDDAHLLSFLHLCQETTPCTGTFLADVDGDGGFYVAGSDPGIIGIAPHVFVSAFASDGTAGSSARINTGFGDEGFWRGVEGDSTGRVLGWTQAFRNRGTIDFGDGDVTVNVGVTAAALYDASSALVWKRRYRGSVTGGAFTADGGFALLVADADRRYVEVHDRDGTLLLSFDLPIDGLDVSAFDVSTRGDFYLVGELDRSADFGGGIRSPLLTTVFVASYAPDGTYRYDRLFGDDTADVLLSAFTVADDQLVFAADVTGTLDFGGGTRTGPGDYLWVLRD